MDSRNVDDLSYEAHEERQRDQCSREAIEKGVATLRTGKCAAWDGAAWQLHPYPGYAFQAMASSDERNTETVDRLVRIRDGLLRVVPEPGKLFPLSAASFHQTVINTFSADRLQKFVAKPGLLSAFPSMLASSLDTGSHSGKVETAEMRLSGVAPFGTAIGILGVFPEPDHYQRILAIRERAYGHELLREIGLQRTRPFIAHVTLAYVADDLDTGERSALASVISECNKGLADQPLPFHMPEATLHSYETLAEYAPHEIDLRLLI